MLNSASSKHNPGLKAVSWIVATDLAVHKNHLGIMRLSKAGNGAQEVSLKLGTSDTIQVM